MAPGDIARLDHELTSYGPEKDFPPKAADHPLVLQDFVANDIPTWPPQVKAYPDGLRRVELPRDWPPVHVPATAVLAAPCKKALVAEIWVSTEHDRYKAGEYVRGLAKLEAQERERYAGFATKAIAAGLAERQVRLAKRQGELIAEAIRGILSDLQLTSEQQAWQLERFGVIWLRWRRDFRRFLERVTPAPGPGHTTANGSATARSTSAIAGAALGLMRAPRTMNAISPQGTTIQMA